MPIYHHNPNALVAVTHQYFSRLQKHLQKQQHARHASRLPIVQGKPQHTETARGGERAQAALASRSRGALRGVRPQSVENVTGVAAAEQEDIGAMGILGQVSEEVLGRRTA